MWSCEEFSDYLSEEFGDDPFQTLIWPQIKKYVKASLQSVQDKMDNRKNSFEFFGYDFMVDTDLRVWLIEVNASPSMDMGTPVTARLVQNVLVDLCKVIIDYAGAKNKREVDTGGFCLVYRSGVEVQRPQAVNLQGIIVEGKKIEQKKKTGTKVKKQIVPTNRKELYREPVRKEKKQESEQRVEQQRFDLQPAKIKNLEEQLEKYLEKEKNVDKMIDEINDLHKQVSK